MNDFLLVIPAFEESARLPQYLEALGAELSAAGLNVRVQVVDDGSSAAERRKLADVVRGFSERWPAIAPVLELPMNRGKGGAIMAGWASARGARHLAFVDADGAIPAGEVARVFRLALAADSARKSYFASRVKMLGRVVERSFSRHLIGRVYASLVGTLVHSGIYDSQCGFKVVPGEALPALLEMIREHRFAFDVELLTALVELGFPIEEVPIDWRDIPGSKVSLVKDSARMFLSLVRIRTNRKRWRSAALCSSFQPCPAGLE